MAITKTYSLEFLRNLDLAQGPASIVHDVIGLAGGGFAALGVGAGGALDLDIVNTNYSDGGGANGLTATNEPNARSGLAQLSDGNIVIGYTPFNAPPLVEIRSPSGTIVVAPFPVGQSYNLQVAALTNGGFVITRDGLLPGSAGGEVGSSRWALYNNAGTFLIEGSLGGNTHAIAALDDGGFAIATWSGTDAGSLSVAVYNANGSVRLAQTVVDATGAEGIPAITATDGGFALLYAVSGYSANDDIGIRRFDANGVQNYFARLTGGGTIDEMPDIARLPDGRLAVSWTYSYVSVNDSETFAGIFDPATGTYDDYRTVTGGEPLTDDTDAPKIAVHGGRIAVFHNNRTDNDVDGEDLKVVRTSNGDAAPDFVDSNGDDYADVINGWSGNDILLGRANNDTLNGGLDDDTLGGGAGDDVLDGGGGSDTAYYGDSTGGVIVDLRITTSQLVGGGSGRDTLNGIENIQGSFFADRLTGTDGANRLTANLGADTLTGGLGNDTYVVRDPLVQTVEAANGGIDLVISTGAAYTLQANVENLTIVYENGSYIGDVQNATGNALANILTGNNRKNTLDGLGGNDSIDGGTDNDWLKGGDGNDTLDGGGGGDKDTLDGGAGADIMVGKGGDDTFYVDNAADLIYDDLDSGSIGTPPGIDTVYASISYVFGIGTLLHLLDGAVNGTGNGFDNEMFGNAAANVLDGSTGADTLHGGGGNDTLGSYETSPSGGENFADVMQGGAGNDTYVIEALDVVIELLGEGTDTVQSESTYTLGANVERLFLTGTLAINGAGNGLANLVLGNDATNTLSGLDGDDTLNGGGGADTINGGSGLDRLIGGLQRDKIIPGADNVRDTIVFTLIGESTGQTRDVIEGLDLNAEDRLDLPGTVTAVAAARSGTLSLATFNQNFSSVINAAALPTHNAVLFTPTSGDLAKPGMVYLVVDANNVAGYQANQDWVFQLENHTGALDTTDFI